MDVNTANILPLIWASKLGLTAGTGPEGLLPLSTTTTAGGSPVCSPTTTLTRQNLAALAAVNGQGLNGQQLNNITSCSPPQSPEQQRNTGNCATTTTNNNNPWSAAFPNAGGGGGGDLSASFKQLLAMAGGNEQQQQQMLTSEHFLAAVAAGLPTSGLTGSGNNNANNCDQLSLQQALMARLSQMSMLANTNSSANDKANAEGLRSSQAMATAATGMPSSQITNDQLGLSSYSPTSGQHQQNTLLHHQQQQQQQLRMHTNLSPKQAHLLSMLPNYCNTSSPGKSDLPSWYSRMRVGFNLERKEKNI